MCVHIKDIMTYIMINTVITPQVRGMGVRKHKGETNLIPKVSIIRLSEPQAFVDFIDRQ